MRVDPAIKEQALPAYGQNAVAVRQFARPAGALCFSLHWHDRIELIRVLEGSLHFDLNGAFVKTIEEGEMAIVCPRQIHRGTAGEQGVRYDVVMFEPERFSNHIPAVSTMLASLADAHLVFDQHSAQPDVVAAFDAVARAGQDNPMESVGGVYRLLGLMMKHCHPVQTERLPADERFGAVVEYVNAHFLEPVTAQSVSEQFGYDESYFCRRFKKTTGITLLKYVEILRLEQAKKLLQHSGDAISAIALKSGFGDVCYFSARFHRHFGLSPSHFRKQNRGMKA